MFQSPLSDANASTDSHGNILPNPLPNPQENPDTLRHMLFGSRARVQRTIMLLYKLNYADPGDWSKPTPTGNTNEVVSVLTRRGKG